jgi:hypothetical protein
MAVIKMHPVVSSNIAAAGYDKDTKTLQITFKNGMTYSYSDVPLAMYEGIFTSDSAGKFVREFIVKGKYKSSKKDK